MRSPALGVSKGFQVRRNKRIESAMTDKELRKLKRIELLELLVEQAEETEQLREQLRQAEDALLVDTTGNSLDESLDVLLETIKERLKA